MNRTLKHTLVGFVGSAALAVPGYGQDATPATIVATAPCSVTKAVADKPYEAPLSAYIAAGYEVFDASDDASIDVTQPGPFELEVADASPSDSLIGIASHKKSIVRAEFTVEAMSATYKEVDEGSDIKPRFHCGLTYDGRVVAVDVLDARPIGSDSFSDADAAAKVADALIRQFEEAGDDASVVITRRGNKVIVEVTSVDEAEAIESVTLGGDSRRFKITANVFSAEAFGGAFSSHKVFPAGGQTGGPLHPPIDQPDLGSADGIDSTGEWEPN